MKRIVIVAVIVVAACTSSVPPPAVAPRAEDHYLIDPRTGFGVIANASIEKKFDAAWRALMGGDQSDALRRLTEIRTKEPDYAPAELALAAADLRVGAVAAARAKVDEVRKARPQYLAGEIYDAEVAVAEHDVKRAYTLYRDIAARGDAPPTAAQRFSEMQTKYFALLYDAAAHGPNEESAIALLREALQVNPNAGAARILLAQKLVALRQYEEARREIDPVLSTGDVDRAEVQQVLAEIDLSRGRYEDAIARYDRLVRRGGEAYAGRLDEIKLQYAEANMPLQFKRAIEDESVTRADLAVLMYWKVSSVRFAQNLPTPPIAIDISETPGREELIRAIALGVFSVDPVTRRVNPGSAVSAAALTRTAARLLALRGADCARGLPQNDPPRILAACGITDPSLAGGELTVSGRTAAGVMEQVDRALK